MDGATLGIALVALVIGAVLGWLFAGRQAGARGAELARAQAEREGFEIQFKKAIADLEGAVASRDALSIELAALKTERTERERAFEERMAELREAKDGLTRQFREVSDALLEKAQAQFLEKAGERFKQSETETNHKLTQLLGPVSERLKKYEDQVEKVEKERTEAYGSLTSLIGEMKLGQERVSSEAARLVNSLRNAPKARGRWGEQQLKNVLESCGLSEHVDFALESSVEGEDGRLRPDAVVRVPGGQSLVIDAKVSLNAYQDAFAAEDDAGRDSALTAHCASMKAHIDGLSKKAYWDQFDDAPDYVVMFVPGEHFVAAALEHSPDLWDYAFEKKVLLATPTNLVAIARTVASVWRQEKMAAEAKQIGALGKELYDRLAVTAEHLKRVGAGLNSAVGNYNKFVGSFERNVLSTGRRFAELNIETGKRRIEDVAPVEALPRYVEGPEEDDPGIGEKGDERAEREEREETGARG